MEFVYMARVRFTDTPQLHGIISEDDPTISFDGRCCATSIFTARAMPHPIRMTVIRNPTFSIPISALSINIDLWEIVSFGRCKPEAEIESDSQSFELWKTWK
jgi:hypothetical protein